jgi:hypothetical protein
MYLDFQPFQPDNPMQAWRPVQNSLMINSLIQPEINIQKSVQFKYLSVNDQFKK